MEITSELVQVMAEFGDMPAFLARPIDENDHPAVIVVMEAFGLNQQIKEVAQRLAREGYIAIAPDLYYRENDTVVGYDNLPDALRLMLSLYDDKIIADMNGVVRWLAAQPFVRADRIGVTGFCMGGRVSFLSACRIHAIKAAAPFYGGGIGVVMHPNERTPTAPLDYADKLACPMLLFFGGDDPFIPMDEVQKIEQRLTRLGKASEVVVYPGAPHGFFCNGRESYRSDAAADAWKRLIEFFARHLQA